MINIEDSIKVKIFNEVCVCVCVSVCVI